VELNLYEAHAGSLTRAPGTSGVRQPNKDMRLLAQEDGSYERFSPSAYRIARKLERVDRWGGLCEPPTYRLDSRQPVANAPDHAGYRRLGLAHAPRPVRSATTNRGPSRLKAADTHPSTEARAT
jgi:hypothetical protein